MSSFSPFIKSLTQLPETKSLSLLLLLAEEANKVTFRHFQALSLQTTKHINQCWYWLGDRQKPVEVLQAAFYNNTIELLHHNKDMETAVKVSNAVLDYISYKSLETVGNTCPQNQFPQNQFPMLAYVFNNIPLQDFATPDILHFADL